MTGSSNLANMSTNKVIFHVQVRGHKNVVRHFPHEVEDLVFVLDLLEGQGQDAVWEIKFILILWLSIIVIIPFQMSRFDSGEKEPTANRILNICQSKSVSFFYEEKPAS